MSHTYYTSLGVPTIPSLPISLRLATPHDIPSIASISASTLADDNLFAYLHPGRLSYPTSFRNQFLRRTKLRFYTPGFVYVVAVSTTYLEEKVKEDGEYEDKREGEVLGFACFSRQGTSPSTRNWRRDSLAAWVERCFASLEQSYIDLFRLDRSLSPENLATYLASTASSEDAPNEDDLYPLHLVPPEDPEAGYWILHNLFVDPKYQRKGVGGALLRWGLRRAQEEGVGVGLTTSFMGKALYVREGFEVLGAMETPVGKEEVMGWKPKGIKRDGGDVEQSNPP